MLLHWRHSRAPKLVFFALQIKCQFLWNMFTVFFCSVELSRDVMNFDNRIGLVLIFPSNRHNIEAKEPKPTLNSLSAISVRLEASIFFPIEMSIFLSWGSVPRVSQAKPINQTYWVRRNGLEKRFSSWKHLRSESLIKNELTFSEWTEKSTTSP